MIINLCLLGACQRQTHSQSPLFTINKLPKQLNESSGIASVSSNNYLWMINDSGNDPLLYKIDLNGTIVSTIKVTNATNIDWEDLATDGQYMLYIGDFGNNGNKRKDLCIYAIDIRNITDNKVKATKIKFALSDQNKFPPKKKNRNFDIEAFVYANGFFYFFTKNRSKPFDGTSKMYKLKAQKGNHKARLLGSIPVCEDASNCKITAAASSNDQLKIALLTHDRILLYENLKNIDILPQSEYSTIQLYHKSQKEALCFLGDNLYITDEKTKHGGAYLYRIDNLVIR